MANVVGVDFFLDCDTISVDGNEVVTLKFNELGGPKNG